MVVKYIAALAYTAVWGVIFLGIFRPLDPIIWCVMLVLAVIGALSAWNALAPPKHDDGPLQDDPDPSHCCDGSHDIGAAPLKSVKPTKL